MYLLDSSSVIHLWDNYPIGNTKLFSDFWGWIEERIFSQEYRINKTVLAESAKIPECQKWFKEKNIFTYDDKNLQTLNKAIEIKSLLGIEDDNYHSKGVNENDIFIIATAKIHHLSLVTEENRQLTLPDKMVKYKIPAVSKKINVSCHQIINLIPKS